MSSLKQKTKNRTVFVAMSGGVDSSVAAALLKRQGYDVTGVFMRPWSPNRANHKSQITNHKQTPNSKFEIQNSDLCMWQKDREDAMRVAAKLDIPLLTWDFSKEYKKEVTDYMIKEYRAGRTPNPDVMCNKHIKFGLFLQKALKEGADFIATGHYVRLMRKSDANIRMHANDTNKKIRNIRIENSQHSYRLLIAKDKNKDQSYFLWTLTRGQLKYCLFPIGDYTKPEVRKMAKKSGLPVHNKKDSQGVCFVGPLDMKEFLKNYIKLKRGKILSVDGREIGTHDGIFYYTIGQRHGLNLQIKNKELGIKGQHKTKAHYVASKDTKNNDLIVAEGDDNPALFKKEIRIKDVNFIARHHSQILKNLGIKGQQISAKMRYRQPLVKSKLYLIRNSKFVILKLDRPVKFVAPGQSAVFYRGEELIGGGIIS